MVELDSLENCCGASHRGFESHSLRFFLNSRSKIALAKLLFFSCGAVAQLGECIPRTDEVTGSNPVCSIRSCAIIAQFVFALHASIWN